MRATAAPALLQDRDVYNEADKAASHGWQPALQGGKATAAGPRAPATRQRVSPTLTAGTREYQLGRQ